MNTFTIPDTGLTLNAAGTDVAVLSPADGAAYTKALLTRTLIAFRGTWRYNLLAGIPYFEQIFVKEPDLNVVRTLFLDALRSTGAVIESLTVTRTGKHTLQVDFVADGDPVSLEI